MEGTARNADVERLRALLGRRCREDLSRYSSSFLALSLERHVARQGGDVEGYLSRLESDPGEADDLLSSLDIHFSEFFRDPLAFALLERRVVPGLLAQAPGREVRVWCTACSAGQEAYSLAMLFLEAAAEAARPPAFRIFATDVSEPQLELARRAEYEAAVLRQVRLGRVERWFTREGSRYRPVPEVRAQVDFSRHDLLDGATLCPQASIFGGFDLILCCNLLYYFSAEAQQRVLGRLRACLAPAGYLVTGEVEREQVLASGGLRPVAALPAVFQNGG